MRREASICPSLCMCVCVCVCRYEVRYCFQQTFAAFDHIEETDRTAVEIKLGGDMDKDKANQIVHAQVRRWTDREGMVHTETS